MDSLRSGSELSSRTASGLILAAACAPALYFGGLAFAALCAAVGGIMVWEVSRLSDPGIPRALAAGLGIGAAAAAFAAALPAFSAAVQTILLAAAPAAGIICLRSGRTRFFVFGFLTLLAVSVLYSVRQETGAAAALWIIATVITSDVAGFFAGKSIGGPKLAPKLSPKKTWSGACAGWAGAALIGYLFQSVYSEASVFAGICVAAAAQAGDLGESWLKRAADAKDSSSLLPGHGGFCDRFDGMAGGCLGYWMVLKVGALAAGGAVGSL